MSQIGSRVAVGFLRSYQALLSPILGPACRFEPTCSNYAISAIRERGAAKGLWLSARRIARCHPLGGSGYDPVPEQVSDGS